MNLWKERPPGIVTPELIKALAADFKGVCGSIPPDAKVVLEETSKEVTA